MEQLYRMRQKLRSYGIPTEYVAIRIPWEKVGTVGTWLADSEKCVDGDPQNFFEGIILPKGAPNPFKVPCGHLNIELPPQIANLIPRRTAFIDCRLNELIKRYDFLGNICDSHELVKSTLHSSSPLKSSVFSEHGSTGTSMNRKNTSHSRRLNIPPG